MLVLMLTVGAFAIIMAAMALGLMLRGRSLRGSCGGVAGPGCACKQAGTDPTVCPRTRPTPADTMAKPHRSLDVLPDVPAAKRQSRASTR